MKEEDEGKTALATKTAAKFDFFRRLGAIIRTRDLPQPMYSVPCSHIINTLYMPIYDQQQSISINMCIYITKKKLDVNFTS